ncbi:hypothetical protein NFI96_029820, partial [Prochilodus magdalenae]
VSLISGVFLALVLPLLVGSTSLSQLFPKDCSDVALSGQTLSGVYTIYPADLTPVLVYCDMGCDGKPENGKWTVIQRRMDGTVNFYRPWDPYKIGFGKKYGEYWLGLENIHQLTRRRRYELRVDLEDFEGNKVYAQYSTFSVGSEADGYRLHVGGFTDGGAGEIQIQKSMVMDISKFGSKPLLPSGPTRLSLLPGMALPQACLRSLSRSMLASDSLESSNGQKFSTFDKDQDSSETNCARTYLGAFWYGNCHHANPNGVYLWGDDKDHYPIGNVWFHWKGYLELVPEPDSLREQNILGTAVAQRGDLTGLLSVQELQQEPSEGQGHAAGRLLFIDVQLKGSHPGLSATHTVLVQILISRIKLFGIEAFVCFVQLLELNHAGVIQKVLLLLAPLLPLLVGMASGSQRSMDCSDVYLKGQTRNGVYTIFPTGSAPVQVYCDMCCEGSGYKRWTVIQGRMDGRVNFYRPWQPYKIGFGNLNGEYWLGLENLYQLTRRRRFELRVDLEDFEGNKNLKNLKQAATNSMLGDSLMEEQPLSYCDESSFRGMGGFEAGLVDVLKLVLGEKGGELIVDSTVGATLAVLKACGTHPEDREEFIREEMKGSRSREIDRSSVDGMGSSGQVVGLLDSSSCRTSSVESDSLTYHNGQKFSTYDKDQDSSTTNCARTYLGAFWYSNCHYANPNGIYLGGDDKTFFAIGNVWYHWKGFESGLKAITMKIRPVA